MMSMPRIVVPQHRCLAAWFLLGALLLGLCDFARAGTPRGDTSSGADVEVFVRAGCPHCEEAEGFLATLSRERPTLRVTIRDVVKDPDALERLRDELLVGYTGEAGTGTRIRSATMAICCSTMPCTCLTTSWSSASASSR